MKIANWSKFLNRKNKEAVLKNRNMWDFFRMQNRPKHVLMVVIPLPPLGGQVGTVHNFTNFY